MNNDIRLRTAEAADYDRIIAVVDNWWGRPWFTVTGPVPGYDGPSSDAKMLFERRLT
jgi:hypothetical protein